ncbi:hypothetical protein HNQ51_003083 [Inhella inkyongensis]|uniref:Beta-ketoacyl synthase-like N-terminal domain-containing protein n=1 Tax=Inhella inkyongensis TaxID=392593 RepID=A0A840S9T1_9BURK|nr:beta-ketoacyl synthase chain length factor [Inhella inkyongensis]MBB5205756.1 hypothetical protein [Inhella inkyongensis]
MPADTALTIARWSAWAPGLESQSDWLQWLAAPCESPPQADKGPPLTEVPAMVRRRIEPLGRAALQVAYWAQEGLPTEQVQATPLVFASRWGELARSLGLLQDLAQGQPLSPTAFSHSVHNAIGALYSIQRGIRANVSAVAAGAFSAESAWLEASALIAEGAPEVLLVVFEAPLPEPYAESSLAGLRAFALRLCAAPAGGVRLSRDAALADEGQDHGQGACGLPADLGALRFLLGDAPELRQGGWRWVRS